jgi:hypothetical protein
MVEDYSWATDETDTLRAQVGQLERRCIALERQLKDARDTRRNLQTLINAERDSDAWIWMDDEDNDLASMSDGMVVLITAGQLRRLLEP